MQTIANSKSEGGEEATRGFGLTARSKDATRGSWPYYMGLLLGQEATRVQFCSFVSGL